MSQYQTYKGYALPNQLVQLQTQWAAMKANQIYACGQGKMFNINLYTTDMSSVEPGIVLSKDITVDFPVPASYCATEIYATIDGVRYRIDPLYYDAHPNTFMVGQLNIKPHFNDNTLTKWFLNFDAFVYSTSITVTTVEVNLISNVKPSKITVV